MWNRVLDTLRVLVLALLTACGGGDPEDQDQERVKLDPPACDGDRSACQ
jgi:hypothetical protein